MAAPPGTRLTLDFAQDARPDPSAAVALAFEDWSPPLVGLGLGDQSEVGSPAVTQQLVIRPAGFKASSFGLLRIARDAKRLYPAGIVQSAVPGPYQVSWTQYLTAGPGPYQAEVPAGASVTLAGGYHAAPGSSVVLNFLEALTPPPGSNTILEFGAAGYGRLQSVSLGIATQFGQPALTLQTLVKPIGIAPAGLGQPNVAASNRTISLAGSGIAPPAGQVSSGVVLTLGSAVLSPAGWASAAFGSATTYLARRYVTGAGQINSSGLGTPEVELVQQVAAPAGVVGTQFGTASLVNWSKELWPSGFDGTQFGQPSAWNWDTHVRPSGFKDGAYGTAFVADFTRYVVSQGYRFTQFGTPGVVNLTQEARPSGIASVAAAGQPTVDFRVRYLGPDGISSTAAYGDPAVWNFNKEVYPSGLAASQFGQPTAYNLTQVSWADGFDHVEFGTPEIGWINQACALEGFESSAFGQPTVYQPIQYARPEGAAPGGFGNTWVRREADATLMNYGLLLTM